ncbi:MAG: hypothetical protein ACI9IZ_001334, partial [Nonlabens sp.]
MVLAMTLKITFTAIDSNALKNGSIFFTNDIIKI